MLRHPHAGPRLSAVVWPAVVAEADLAACTPAWLSGRPESVIMAAARSTLREKNNWLIHELYVRREFGQCLRLVDEQLEASGGLSEYPLYAKGACFVAVAQFKSGSMLFTRWAWQQRPVFLCVLRSRPWRLTRHDLIRVVTCRCDCRADSAPTRANFGVAAAVSSCSLPLASISAHSQASGPFAAAPRQAQTCSGCFGAGRRVWGQRGLGGPPLQGIVLSVPSGPQQRDRVFRRGKFHPPAR